MIAFPKKERGGSGLGSHEVSHIFRDPHRSIHTRKKERVGTADVNHMTRENPDRYSDAIQKFARGVNPMAGVSYATGGAKLTSRATQPQGHNAYKVNKKFVPPLIRQEDLLPLSRQRRDLTSVKSNIKSPFLFIQTVNETKIDYEPIKKTIHINPQFQRSSGGMQNQFSDNIVLDVKRQNYSMQTGAVAPNKTYNVQNGQEWDLKTKTKAGSVQSAVNAPLSQHQSPDASTIDKGIIIRPSVSASTNKGVSATIQVTDLNSRQVTREIKEETLRGYLPSTYKIAFYNPITKDYKEMKLPENLKEKIVADVNKSAPIFVRSEGDNGLIKLKDYNWAVHRTNVGSSTLFIESKERPEIFLRNDPTIVSVSAQVEAKLRLNAPVNAPILEGNRPVISVGAMPNAVNVSDNMNRDFNLPPSLRVGGFSNHGVNPSKYIKIQNPTTLTRTLEKKMNLSKELSKSI